LKRTYLMSVAFASVGLLAVPMARGQAAAPPTEPAAALHVPRPTFPNLKDTEFSFVYLDEFGYPPGASNDGQCLKRFVTRHISVSPRKPDPRAHPFPQVPTKNVKWTVVNACETAPLPRATPMPSPTPAPGMVAKVQTCQEATVTLRTWEYLSAEDLARNPRPAPRPIKDLTELFKDCDDAEVVWQGTGTDTPYVRRHVPFRQARSFECKLNDKASRAGRYWYIVELSMCGTFIENRDPVIDIPW
jgi:hypothetical protein